MNGEPLVHKAEPLLSQSACVVGHPSKDLCILGWVYQWTLSTPHSFVQ